MRERVSNRSHPNGIRTFTCEPPSSDSAHTSAAIVARDRERATWGMIHDAHQSRKKKTMPRWLHPPHPTTIKPDINSNPPPQALPSSTRKSGGQVPNVRLATKIQKIALTSTTQPPPNVPNCTLQGDGLMFICSV